MNKSLVIVTSRATLVQTTYYDIEDIEIVYGDYKPVEFIVTEKNGVKHHFPTLHYFYELYKQIDEKLNTKLRIADDSCKNMFKNYTPKFYLNKKEKTK